MEFNNPTGTTSNGFVQVTATFDNESCINTSTISIKVTDANGCPKTQIVNFPSPCSNFTVNSITESAGNVFSVSASAPNCASVTFDWDYDTSIFSTTSLSSGAFTSSLDLNFNAVSNLPSSTIIRCTVTDCNNCSKTVTYNKSICVPQAENIVVNMI